ncbi:MAG TPA: enoyl-CoA hydratase-related protein [Novosphingobium sp.]|nr:enoyl-CoA hydratase-related protein [Novosphingobium sp.]
MMPDSGGASLTVDQGVATILFDRRSARNAMLQATWHALPGLIATAEADERVAAIVLRGAGGHFGAGNDIAEFGLIRSDAAKCRAYGQAMVDAMLAVERATKPVIAAIEGSCFGASVALALAADFRVAAADARFAITPAKLGALYLRSDLHRLVAAIGQGHARRMLFTAATIDSAEARAIGLVEQLAAPVQFDAELDRILQAICGGSLFTLHHSKRMLRSQGHGETPVEDDESIGWFVAAMQGADFAEGHAAFMAKRTPQFPGALVLD